MQPRPRSFPLFLVLGSVLWIGVTVACISVIVKAPTENAGLALGLGLMWLVLLAFVAVERFTGGRRPS